MCIQLLRIIMVSRYLHSALSSGEGREQTLPTYQRIVSLRRGCAEEMRRLFLGVPALKKLANAGEIVRQLDPYYGLDPDRGNHSNAPRLGTP